MEHKDQFRLHSELEQTAAHEGSDYGREEKEKNNLLTWTLNCKDPRLTGCFACRRTNIENNLNITRHLLAVLTQVQTPIYSYTTFT
jgi:hypothetical protein